MEVGLDALLAEMQRIKATLTSGAPVSDLQLFAHMRAVASTAEQGGSALFGGVP